MKPVILLLLIMLIGPVIPSFAGDVVISEILFNPAKEGYDYVEGYNCSDHSIDLAGLFIARRDGAGEIAGIKPVSRETILLPPDAYFVVTGNDKWLRQHYHVPADAIVCQLAGMPSFPDDAGTAVFLDTGRNILDELSYSEKWHFALLSDRSGVALERIDLLLPTQNPNNWTSASSASGFGTPGYRNSQHSDGRLPGEEGTMAVTPVFSPDNDGFEDLALIRFTGLATGFVANTAVYDMSGRKVRSLLKNETLGERAEYKWDGLDERSQPLPQGVYVLVTDLFNLSGKTRKFRQVVILARRPPG